MDVMPTERLVIIENSGPGHDLVVRERLPWTGTGPARGAYEDALRADSGGNVEHDDRHEDEPAFAATTASATPGTVTTRHN